MHYTEMEKMVIATAEGLIDKFILPSARKIDEEEIFPYDNFKKIGELGLLGINFDEAYEGAGLDFRSYLTFIQKVAHSCASTAMTIVSHCSLTCKPIEKYGTVEQKNKFLIPLLQGEKIGAFALTEPDSGSDISSIQTNAHEKDDCYLLNGNKVFITNVNVADTYLVAAKTNADQGIMGISMFLLDREMAGLSTSDKKEKKLGMRGSDTGELILKNVKVPKENLVGKKNLGYMVLNDTLISARLGMASIASGIAEGARDICVKYVKERKQFGKHLYRFQSIKNKLADMEMLISASNLLIDHACKKKMNGGKIDKEASEAKLFASEAVNRITKDAIQLLGAYGYSRDFPLERFYRDAKITEIGDGTSEIQRLIIAEEVIKKKII